MREHCGEAQAGCCPSFDNGHVLIYCISSPRYALRCHHEVLTIACAISARCSLSLPVMRRALVHECMCAVVQSTWTPLEILGLEGRLQNAALPCQHCKPPLRLLWSRLQIRLRRLPSQPLFSGQ